MLSDGTLRGVKPQATTYKIADRDGMLRDRLPERARSLSSRLPAQTAGGNAHDRPLWVQGRISLLMAREALHGSAQGDRRRPIPSQEKQREKRRMSEAKTFDEFTKRWLEEARMAESTKSMRKSIIDRDIMPGVPQSADGRDRPGGPAQSVRQRQGARPLRPPRCTCATSSSRCSVSRRCMATRRPNPADEVGPSSIATFVPRDRALSPSEIRVMHRVLDATATLPTIRLALRLILLTLVRKSELIEATWDEVDFENAVWTIPKAA